MSKTAFITGGTKGIGLATVEALLKANYQVAFTGRNPEQLKEVEDHLLIRFPGKVLGIVADVRSLSSMQSAAKGVISKLGSIDVLIANAGIGIFKNISELSEEDWNQTIDTNLSGVFYSVKSCLDELIQNKGYIITIASLAGTNFFANGSAYNASKFGLVGFSQALMLDVRDKDVKVSTIMPGSVSTHFSGRTPDPEADSWKIQPEDIANIILDLLQMNPRTLPSKIEVRPSKTHQ